MNTHLETGETVAKPKIRGPFAARLARRLHPRRARSTFVPVRAVVLSR